MKLKQFGGAVLAGVAAVVGMMFLIIANLEIIAAAEGSHANMAAAMFMSGLAWLGIAMAGWFAWEEN